MLRVAVASLVLLASSLVAAPPVAATSWFGHPLCGVSGGVIHLIDPTDCVVETTSITTTAAKTVAGLNAKTFIDDARAVNTSQLSEYFIHIYCYDGAGALVFRESAAHNLWPGVSINVIARGVFTPSITGTYSCGVVAHLQGGSGAGNDFSIADSQVGHYLTAYAYGAGIESPGPNPPTDWPSPDYTTLSPATPSYQVVRQEWFGAPTTGYVRAVSDIQLSRCSPGDYPDKCSHLQSGTTPPISVKVRLEAWQAISASSTTVCPGTTPYDETVTLTISYATHHDTAVQVGSFIPSASCPGGHMIAKVLVTVTTSGGYVFFGAGGSAVGLYGPATS